MTKPLTRTSSFPKTLALITAVVLLVLAIFFALEKFNITSLTNVSSGSSSEDASGGTSGPTEEESARQTESEANQKQDYLDSVSSSTDSGDTSSSNSTSTPSSASMTVSASQSGSNVTVLTQIQNVAQGSCTLTATNGSKTTTQTAQIIYQPEFSSCAGFSVATTTIGTGAWTISITATPVNGPTITQSTNLEVK